MYKYGVRDPGLIIANSTSVFNQGCYIDKVVINENDQGEETRKSSRSFVGKFRYEETENNRLLKKYAANNSGIDVEYDFGEIA